MTPERYKQIGQICYAALQLEPGQRGAFLDQACADDAELRHEVESLLAHENRAECFIETRALDVAARMMAAGGADPLTHKRIGPYEVLSLLNRGGMGEVYLAHDARLGRKVALKLLPAEFTKDEGRLRRFEQEARAASALNHPNIITIYEVGEADGVHFIATEFIDGHTLRQHLHEGRMPVREVLAVGAQAAGALAAAHAAGIVHRDIKQENVMLRPDGYIKVVDFGLAKLAERHPTTGSEDPSTLPDSPSALLLYRAPGP
jgi:eukaryotic-like serine/threonine-protein kinase